MLKQNVISQLADLFNFLAFFYAGFCEKNIFNIGQCSYVHSKTACETRNWETCNLCSKLLWKTIPLDKYLWPFSAVFRLSLHLDRCFLIIVMALNRNYWSLRKSSNLHIKSSGASSACISVSHCNYAFWLLMSLKGILWITNNLKAA